MVTDPFVRAASAEMVAAAKRIDVLDIAGALIANPDRTLPSKNAQLGMAMAIERMWAVCIEAEILVNALERTMPWADGADAEHREHVALQAGHIRTLMLAFPKEPKETDDGSSHS